MKVTGQCNCLAYGVGFTAPKETETQNSHQACQV